MFSNPDYLNVKADNVFLTPMPMNKYKNTNYEPQYVSVRAINSASIYVHSDDCKLETNKVNMLVSTIKQQGDSASTLFTNICRLKTAMIEMYLTTPAVNNRNNTFRFYSSLDAAWFEFDLDETFFGNIANMVAALQTELNASGSSLVFTLASALGGYYTMSVAAGTFEFDPECSAMKKGYVVWNIPSDVISNAVVFGPIFTSYTRYIDVCSDTLTKYAKIQNSSTGYNNNILFRILVSPYSSPTLQSGVEEYPAAYSFKSDDSISFFDIKFYDEFGEIFYLPTDFSGIPFRQNFWWSLRLLTEA